MHVFRGFFCFVCDAAVLCKSIHILRRHSIWEPMRHHWHLGSNNIVRVQRCNSGEMGNYFINPTSTDNKISQKPNKTVYIFYGKYCIFQSSWREPVVTWDAPFSWFPWIMESANVNSHSSNMNSHMLNVLYDQRLINSTVTPDQREIKIRLTHG